MTEEMAMLRAAALIDKGQRANADGYAKPVGYTKPVYTKQVGYTYAAPIGNLSTKSQEEVVLENALNALEDYTPRNCVSYSSTSKSTSYTGDTFTPGTREHEAKKSFIDRIKENPVMYGLIAAFLAFITFGIYKSKKG